jgi:hypothetical protein
MKKLTATHDFGNTDFLTVNETVCRIFLATFLKRANQSYKLLRIQTRPTHKRAIYLF